MTWAEPPDMEVGHPVAFRLDRLPHQFWTSVDAPGNAREISRRFWPRSRFPSSVRPQLRPSDAAGPYGSSWSGSESNRRAFRTLSKTGFPDLVSSTVVPYPPAGSPTSAASARCRLSRRCARSLVDRARRQDRPGYSGHLVGECYGHEHAWLARQHAREPRSLGRAAVCRMPHH